MKVDNRNILLVIVITTLLLFPAVAFTSGAPRIVLGLCFVLFFPGYTLLSALFPKQGSLGGTERIALSFGLSLAVIPLIGLILNYTPWGINLYPALISATIFILVTSSVAWYRQWALPPDERFSITVNISPSGWGTMTGLDKTLSVLLVVAVLVALGSLGYVIATPKQGEGFTEFYILSVDGKAENYPKQVVLGEPVELIIGIVNHEQVITSYRISIRINGLENKEIRTPALANEEKWEETISFVLQSSGDGQRVEFWLYKNDKVEPYFENPLSLSEVDVIEPSSAS